MANPTQEHSVLAARISSLFPLILFAGLAGQVRAVSGGSNAVWGWSWTSTLQVRFAFSLDGLALLFALIVCGVGFFVTIYSADYLRGHRHYGRFFVILHLFLLAMLGVVTADDLLALFVFWELTTLLSYLLIGFEHENEASRRSARQALLVTGTGGLALLLGILLIGTITQSYRISELPVYADVLRSHSLYPAVLVCVFLAAFTKSAQFPFHFWLPNAMAAPTPVSAFLHSATMVKAGIYLLARMHPVLGNTTGWMATLVIVGAVTALLGSIEAMGQKDMKRVLAYTTLMALGILTMFLGGKTTPALTAAATFLLVHSLYKSGLFLVVGIIDHETGTRELGRVGGLLPLMPRTAFGAATAAMSMAGFPLFLGFIGKEIMYKGALTEEMFPAFATTSAVVSNALMAAVAGILLIRPFLGAAHQTPRPAHEPPLGMWLGPAILGGIGLGFGLIPGWVSRWLVAPAVQSFHPSMETVHLKLWHGFNEPLLLSVLTLTLGTAFYLIRRPLRLRVAALLSKWPANGDRAYDAAMTATAATAQWQTRMLQSGSLHRYLYTIIAVFSVTIAVVWFGKDPLWGISFRPSLSGAQWLLSLLMLAAVVVVLRSRSRLLSVCALGVVGAGSALIFLTNGAPDLALTQLLVETLTVIIVAIVLLRLPLLTASPVRSPRRRLLDGSLSAAVGLLIMLLVLAVTAGDPDTTLSAFYEAKSLPGGHGRNIVNVILVDFRSLDTLGEIVVVATAGLAGYGLIRSRRKEE